MYPFHKVQYPDFHIAPMPSLPAVCLFHIICLYISYLCPVPVPLFMLLITSSLFILCCAISKGEMRERWGESGEQTSLSLPPLPPPRTLSVSLEDK